MTLINNAILQIVVCQHARGWWFDNYLMVYSEHISASNQGEFLFQSALELEQTTYIPKQLELSIKVLSSVSSICIRHVSC